MQLLTVGHSNRTFDGFLAILQGHGVEELVDIRTVPKSLRVPWSAGAALGPALEEEGIGYRHMKDLGGLRKPRPNTPNGGWRNTGFRGYADWMETDAFRQALDILLALASRRRTVVMCAEAVPWRCHRSVLADAALVRGVDVFHLMTPGKADAHKLHAFARVDGERITYPPEAVEATGREATKQARLPGTSPADVGTTPVKRSARLRLQADSAKGEH